MDQKYIRHEDGTVDWIDGNYIHRSDGTVDWINGDYIHRSDGTVDWKSGDYIHRGDGSIDWINGNNVHRSNGTIDNICGNRITNEQQSQQSNVYNNSQAKQEWVRTATPRTTDTVYNNYTKKDSIINGIIYVIAIVAIIAVTCVAIYSNIIEEEKNTYYSVYRVTQDCEVGEPLRFSIGAYYIHHLRNGQYIFSQTSESGRVIYYIDKGSEFIRVKVDEDVLWTLKYRGKISEYDYKRNDWITKVK